MDVVQYTGGKRVNFNYNSDEPPPEEAPEAEAEEGPEGAAPAPPEPAVAEPAAVWRRFGEGCSVRLLHPQRHCDPLYRLLARLEAHLRCAVGCNAYLTPPGAQGFAPHWDDIDAFVLQVEGEKRWRLYAPIAASHQLPRCVEKRALGGAEAGDGGGPASAGCSMQHRDPPSNLG